MQLGYFTFPLHPPEREAAVSLAHDLEQLVALDQLGFAEAWIGEHFTSYWEDVPAPDLLIAQALGLTKNIRLGTGVSCLPNHNPVMLAQRIAQLDQMARGRFNWGIGSGGFPGDFELFGVDTEHGEQKTLTRDNLEFILKVWADPVPGTYENKHWRITIPQSRDDIGLGLHMRPYQKPHPPIGVAGVGPKSDMLTLGGQRGWIPMSINIVPTVTLQAHWQTYEASARQAGQPANRSIWRIARDVYIGETTEQARREAIDGVIGRDWEGYFLQSLRGAKMLMALKSDQSMPDDEITLDYLCDNIWIVGDVDEVTRKLRKLYDDVGGFGTLLVIGHEWDPRDKWDRSFHLLTNEVLPRIPSVG